MPAATDAFRELTLPSIGRLTVTSHFSFTSLPMLGRVNSLNASVATGIIMYEIARQRLEK